jgi:hypothetical protein
VDFNDQNYEYDWSKELLNTPYIKKNNNKGEKNDDDDERKKNDSQSDNKPSKHRKSFMNLKLDQEKAFKVKKFINDLPTMENQIKRFPKIYKGSSLCSRCNKYKETLEHLWECPNADNDTLFIQRYSKERFRKLVYHSGKFIRIDDLMNELFPFFKIKKNLKRHTAENAKFYKNLGKTKLDWLYIWDQKDSMDTIFKGIVPRSLIEIMLKYQKTSSLAIIKQILIKWMGKINSLFYERIWKKRNDDMIQWEQSKGITKRLKMNRVNSRKGKNKKKTNQPLPKASSNRERLKRENRACKQITGHLIDLELYEKIKKVMGLNKFILRS